MGLMKAAQLCLQAILCFPRTSPTNIAATRVSSNRCWRVSSSLIQDRGIDEVYLDFTSAEDGQLEGGWVLAVRLQAAIY